MTQPGGGEWREERIDELLRFAAGSRRDAGGFGRLDASGRIDDTADLELWINARMTYVFSLAALRGDDPALAEHGIAALRTTFADTEHGGWFSRVTAAGEPVDTVKRVYDHDFVLLAASAASVAGVAGAEELLDDAVAVHSQRFWDASAGLCVEEISRDWSSVDSYRGANGNMHAVEAYLAAADATGDDAWRHAALEICARLVGKHARAHGWRLPEHYDADWTALPDHNADRPADPFRPWGATPGHALEWARLLVQLDASLDPSPAWLLSCAEALFERTVEDVVTDASGLPYTTGWDGEPVVAERFHWVMAEAVMAAEALHRSSEHAMYAGLRSRWWAEIDRHFIDREHGSWHHELSPSLEPSSTVWGDKPDAYHALNALLLPDLPLAPTFAAALRQRKE